MLLEAGANTEANMVRAKMGEAGGEGGGETGLCLLFLGGPADRV